MNFDDLKVQIAELWATFKDQLNESPAWNNFRERYETLPMTGQLGVRVAAWGFLVFVLLWSPIQCMSTSDEYLDEFADKREIIEDLLQTKAQPSQSIALLGKPLALLQPQIRSAAERAGLAAEQITGIENFDPTAENTSLAPKTEALTQEGVKVMVKDLNLDQVKELGFDLQAINQSFKLTGIDVAPSKEDDHYFNVTYWLTNYRLEPEEPEETEKGQK